MTNGNSNFELLKGPKEGELFTAETFLAYLDLTRDHWWDDQSNLPHCPWVFRGHGDANWKLEPRAASKDPKRNPLAPKKWSHWKVEDCQSSPSIGQVEAIQLYSAHLKAFENFATLAIDLGFIKEMPRFHVSDFKSLWQNRTADYEYKWGTAETESKPILSLAQHHGIPTFLLDWTFNSEIAVQFAANREGDESDKDIAVFSLRRWNGSAELGYNDAPYQFVKIEPAKNPYLAAQRGILTKQMSPSNFIDVGEFQALEDKIQTWNNSYKFPLLRKIILAAPHLPRLRILLQRKGLTIAHLMPTFDNVAKVAIRRTIDNPS